MGQCVFLSIISQELILRFLISNVWVVKRYVLTDILTGMNTDFLSNIRNATNSVQRFFLFERNLKCSLKSRLTEHMRKWGL